MKFQTDYSDSDGNPIEFSIGTDSRYVFLNGELKSIKILYLQGYNEFDESRLKVLGVAVDIKPLLARARRLRDFLNTHARNLRVPSDIDDWIDINRFERLSIEEIEVLIEIRGGRPAKHSD